MLSAGASVVASPDLAPHLLDLPLHALHFAFLLQSLAISLRRRVEFALPLLHLPTYLASYSFEVAKGRGLGCRQGGKPN